jgi:rhodanese-related sulfurtransferase
LDEVMSRNYTALTVDAFEKEIKKGAIVLDTRIPDEFENGFVKGAVNIGLNDRFAEWVGTLFDINEPFVLVTEAGKEHESILRMARVGYENVKGYLSGGFDAWKNAGKETDMIISIDTEEFGIDLKFDNITIMDVRKESEYDAAHVAGALNVVLQQFDKQLPELPKEENIYVHCQGGYRSMIAASLLRRKGFKYVKNVHGGFKAISKTEIPVEVSQPAVN